MPSIACDSLLPDQYPHLDQADLQTVIKTHILGENHAYLVPISLLTSIDISELSQDKLRNHYFDVSNHETQFVDLSHRDLKSLSNHSRLTIAIWEGVHQYKTLIES